MPDKVFDRRIQKTLQLLQNALAALISEKDYDAITIQEILDRANVGRSTFYAHFENKDQLLRSILTLLNERFEEGIRHISAGDKRYEENSSLMPLRVPVCRAESSVVPSNDDKTRAEHPRDTSLP